MLLIFFLISVALSVTLCISAGYTGLVFAAFLLLWAVVSFLALSALYIVVAFVISLFMDKTKIWTEDRPFSRFLLRRTVEVILFFCNVHLHIEGMEKLPNETFLLVGNHKSGFDPMIAIKAFGKRKLNFISKPENFDIPLAGPIMASTGFLAIDREDDRKALRTILAAADRMQRDVCCFGVYPEGTRSRTEEMLPFRNGCFKAAQRAKVPIVVASVKNSGLVTKHAPFRPTHVYFRICGVIDVDTVTTQKTNELSETVRTMLEESLKIN